MAACGNCGGQPCTCFLVKGSSTIAMGTGSAFSPFEVRPDTPLYRYAGHAFDPEGGQLFQANTDTLVLLERDALAPLTGGNMWNSAVPTRLTAPIDGLYVVSGQAARVPAVPDPGNTWDVWIAKNGIASAPLVRRTSGIAFGTGSFVIFLSVTSLIRLNAGDYIELYVRSDKTSITIGLMAVGSLSGIDAGPYLAAQWIGA